MRKTLKTPVTPKKYTLTTGEAVGVFAVMIALALLILAGLFTLTTHTLAVFAVWLLIFRVGGAK